MFTKIKQCIQIFSGKFDLNTNMQHNNIQELHIDFLETEQITTENLVGRRERHYSDITTDKSKLPIIVFKNKPNYKEYISIKESFIKKANDAFYEYILFAKKLPGVEANKTLQSMIDIVFRQYLIRYWDCPASLNHHHSYTWGLCEHSLETACAEAEKGAAWTPLNSVGINDIQRSRYLGAVVAAHFIKGLLHDAYKLYQLRLIGSNGNKTIEFSPLKRIGNLLDFKMVCGENIDMQWDTTTPLHPGRLNVVEFFGMIPSELFKNLPPLVIYEILENLYNAANLESDHLSVSKNIDKNGLYDEQLEVFKQRLSIYINKGIYNGKSYNITKTLFFFSDNFLIIDPTPFFQSLGYNRRDTDMIISCLVYKKLLSSNTSSSGDIKLYKYNSDCASDRNKEKQRVWSAFIDKNFVLSLTTENKIKNLEFRFFLKKSKDTLEKHLGILPDSCFVDDFSNIQSQYSLKESYSINEKTGECTSIGDENIQPDEETNDSLIDEIITDSDIRKKIEISITNIDLYLDCQGEYAWIYVSTDGYVMIEISHMITKLFPTLPNDRNGFSSLNTSLISINFSTSQFPRKLSIECVIPIFSHPDKNQNTYYTSFKTQIIEGYFIVASEYIKNELIKTSIDFSTLFEGCKNK